MYSASNKWSNGNIKEFEFDGIKDHHTDFVMLFFLLTVNKRENTNLLGQMGLKEWTDKEEEFKLNPDLLKWPGTMNCAFH